MNETTDPRPEPPYIAKLKAKKAKELKKIMKTRKVTR